MTRVIVAYATRAGSTHEVAERIGTGLRTAGLDVEVRAADEVDGLDGYDAVVLGGALYMGRWHRDARRFLRRHRELLGRLPVAVFAMGPLTLEEDDVAGARRQLDAALARVPRVAPFEVAIFGGVIDPARLRFPFSRMRATDARDWDAIDAWARRVGEWLDGGLPALDAERGLDARHAQAGVDRHAALG
jgi:menaquinone-dependent protoporphyrinogen oxidase